MGGMEHALREVDDGDLAWGAEGGHRSMAAIRFVRVKARLRCWLPSLTYIGKVIKVLESLESPGSASFSAQKDGGEDARVRTGKSSSHRRARLLGPRTTTVSHMCVDLKRIMNMWAWPGCARSRILGFYLF